MNGGVNKRCALGEHGHFQTPSSRRQFLKWATGTGFLVGTIGPFSAGKTHPSNPRRSERITGDRRLEAYQLHLRIADRHRLDSIPLDLINGDEDRYSAHVVSFGKTLPHLDNGEPDPQAHAALIAQLNTGRGDLPLLVPMGGSTELVNPRGAYSFSLAGRDSFSFDISPPPAFGSSIMAAEMIELYWQALLRDVPFSGYAEAPLVVSACRELSSLDAFSGPRDSATVTPSLLFRGMTEGDRHGPFVSQFLFSTVPQGAYRVEQRCRFPLSGIDYLTTFEDWINDQRGLAPSRDLSLGPTPRYIVSGRDLAYYVYRDFTFQAFLNAALILLSFGSQYTERSPYLVRGCPLGPHSLRMAGESGFVTFGAPHVLEAVAVVSALALQACWRQKWLLHRRLRPEVYAQRVNACRHANADYDIPQHLTQAEALKFMASPSALLPMAYPDGSPAHPAFPGAHATVSGACATVLKAFFRTDIAFPAAVEPTSDGLDLMPFTGPALSVGGELDKLASNIALGRNFGGVHYRSDSTAGLLLGERVAIAYLEDLLGCAPEPFSGFAFNTFDGRVVRVGRFQSEYATALG